MLRPRPFLLVLSLLLAVRSAPAVELRFAPDDGTWPLNGDGSLSVMVDEAAEIRTIELRVAYDVAVLTSVAGVPGALFDAAPCQLFTDFQDGTPGEWYGGCVTMGADCWVTGPGELYRWDFHTEANGFSAVTVLEVALYDAEGVRIEQIDFADTHVFVGDGTAIADQTVAATSLRLCPNPFNPNTRLGFTSATRGTATVEVFDLAGRRVGTVWRGCLGPAGASVIWTGRDNAGERLPSGVYLFRLRDAAGATLVRKGVLLK